MAQAMKLIEKKILQKSPNLHTSCHALMKQKHKEAIGICALKFVTF